MSTGPTLWQLQRQAWSRPTSDIHALRRAWGRAVYNRRRRQIALWRRRQLMALLAQYGYPCGSSLIGVGGRWLYQRYWQETGASVRTFYSDLAGVRAMYARHYPDGPARGACACTPVGQSAAVQSGARRPSSSAYVVGYLALRLALERVLPRGEVEAVLIHAQRLQDRLRPPRRLGAPGERGDAIRPGQASAPGSSPAPGTSSPTVVGSDTETFIWKV